MKAICELCGQEFEKQHHRAKYCPSSCYLQANYNRALARNQRVYTKRNSTEKYLTCRNGVKVKYNLLGCSRCKEYSQNLFAGYCEKCWDEE